jgi:metal-responsive CopG/Arc/MetJ family transcriptional regulator
MPAMYVVCSMSYMRIILDLDDNIIKRINDYWHMRQFPNRAAAVRRLLIAALEEQYPDWVPPSDLKKNTF